MWKRILVVSLTLGFLTFAAVMLSRKIQNTSARFDKVEASLESWKNGIFYGPNSTPESRQVTDKLKVEYGEVVQDFNKLADEQLAFLETSDPVFLGTNHELGRRIAGSERAMKLFDSLKFTLEDFRRGNAYFFERQILVLTWTLFTLEGPGKEPQKVTDGLADKRKQIAKHQEQLAAARAKFESMLKEANAPGVIPAERTAYELSTERSYGFEPKRLPINAEVVTPGLQTDSRAVDEARVRSVTTSVQLLDSALAHYIFLQDRVFGSGDPELSRKFAGADDIIWTTWKRRYEAQFFDVKELLKIIESWKRTLAQSLASVESNTYKYAEDVLVRVIMDAVTIQAKTVEDLTKDLQELVTAVEEAKPTPAKETALERYRREKTEKPK